MKRLSAFLAVALAGTCAASPPGEGSGAPRDASAAASGTWHAVDDSTGLIDDVAGLEALVEAFPDSGSVRLRLLSAQLKTDDKAGAFRTVIALSERGYRFSARGQEQLLGVYEGVEHEKLGQVFATSPVPVAASSIVATIPADALLVESIANDPASSTWVATSVIAQDLFVSRNHEPWRAAHIADAAALTGVAFDPGSGLFWTASGDPGLGSEPVRGFRGLIGYDAATGQADRRIAAPPGANPSDLTISPDGTLYVSDPINGAIYRAAQSAARLEVLVPQGKLRSPQGLAVSVDNRFLYASDYRYGLARVDLRTGTIERVASKAPLFLDGIDALWRYGDDLVGVQNGTSPMRIVRLALSPDGRQVEQAHVIECANPAWTEPLGGAIVGDTLHYVGNGQWDRFIEGGAPDPVRPPEATQVRALSLVERPAIPPE